MFARKAAQFFKNGSKFNGKGNLYFAAAATTVAGSGLGLYYMNKNAAKADMFAEGLHTPNFPFQHASTFGTFDHASIRRGYQVFREVCAACHNTEFVRWRDLIDVAFTEEEVKAMAAEFEYEAGPDDAGEMFMRPGTPADPLPKVYANEQAARAMNNGAYPPDLSLITKARHNGANYVFSLLTGYHDAPEGVEIREGLHFNPYFPGGAIAMARSLYDGLVEYEDGTPATTSQMAKDVVTFLNWASEPELDDRKRRGTQVLIIFSILTAISIYLKRNRFISLKTRKIVHNPPSNWTKKQ
ncbi:Cytochrome c1-2, heme protein, mitochondrial [Smittium culicis]|uniref:quinol--cytochrome-c reductase n=1 Tax=Smittium culicis TaxID=133412 RepID=A0A1R1YBC5_9FUNG|nr:Cytochrome c1-2, heme protein, mitochondrial [Smittium culicis]OMJ28478.1 Cytochrome c1-2, heme protein, mitochondrial [Smittium culicis]